MMFEEGAGEYVEYGLVMPFVTVASKGGPYDDEAYVAGYEMGILDHVLCHLPPSATHRVTIHEANRAQADLIAMRHGFVMHTHGDPSLGWLDVGFTR